MAYKVHAYRGLIDRARTEMKWARDGIALVKSLKRLPETQAEQTPAAQTQAEQTQAAESQAAQ